MQDFFGIISMLVILGYLRTGHFETKMLKCVYNLCPAPKYFDPFELNQTWNYIFTREDMRHIKFKLNSEPNMYECSAQYDYPLSGPT